ncbi:MAG: hypothetical protein R8M45_09720, partial [Ghiorsea sp.]
VSGYLDSAFLNGSTGTLLTAADGALAQDLAHGDYYCIGDLNISANWVINGTVRIFCNGILTVSGSMDGKGRSNSYDGYASAGGQGGNGYFKVAYEVGHIWGHDDPTYESTVTKPVSSAGSIDGLPIDVTGAGFNTAKVASSLSGMPVSLSGGTGGKGANGIAFEPSGHRILAIDYAFVHGYVSYSDAAGFTVFPPLYGGTEVHGGAGLLLCGKRVDIQAGSSIDLSGAEGGQPAAVISNALDIEVFGWNDRATYTYQAGKGGAGGGGSLLCIAQSGIDGSIFINQQPNLSGGDAAQGNNAKAGGGKLMKELL